MSEIVDLDPVEFHHTYYSRTESEAVLSEVMGTMKGSLSLSLIAPDFDATVVVPGLHAVLETNRGTAVKQALADEERWYEPEEWRLHIAVGLGSVATKGTVPDFRLSDRFIGVLHEDLDRIAPTFATLGDMRQKMDHTPAIPALASRIHDLSSVGEPGSWLQDVYGLVSNAVENPTDYTIQTKDLDALHLTTFLPTVPRQLLRRVIVGNVLSNELERRFPNPTESEATALQAFRQYFAADALSGDHWDRLVVSAEQSSIGTISDALLKHSAERLEALATISSLHTTAGARKVFTAWKRLTHRLADREDIFDEQLGLWQQQDVGHSFGGFVEIELDSVLERNTRLTFSEAEKSGPRALILEDDPVQAAHIRQMISAHTPYAVEPRLLFRMPGELADAVDDPTIGLFVLDIQNDEDPIAGIRIAHRILQEIARRVAAGTNVPPVRIILWTMSHQAAADADTYFRELTETPPFEYALQDYDGISTRHTSDDGLPVRLTICLKRWSLHDIQ